MRTISLVSNNYSFVVYVIVIVNVVFNSYVKTSTLPVGISLILIYIDIQGVWKLTVQTLTVGINTKSNEFSRISKNPESRSFRDDES